MKKKLSASLLCLCLLTSSHHLHASDNSESLEQSSHQDALKIRLGSRIVTCLQFAKENFDFVKMVSELQDPSCVPQEMCDAKKEAALLADSFVEQFVNLSYGFYDQVQGCDDLQNLTLLYQDVSQKYNPLAMSIFEKASIDKMAPFEQAHMETTFISHTLWDAISQYVFSCYDSCLTKMDPSIFTCMRASLEGAHFLVKKMEKESLSYKTIVETLLNNEIVHVGFLMQEASQMHQSLLKKSAQCEDEFFLSGHARVAEILFSLFKDPAAVLPRKDEIATLVDAAFDMELDQKTNTVVFYPIFAKDIQVKPLKALFDCLKAGGTLEDINAVLTQYFPEDFPAGKNLLDAQVLASMKGLTRAQRRELQRKIEKAAKKKAPAASSVTPRRMYLHAIIAQRYLETARRILEKTNSAPYEEVAPLAKTLADHYGVCSDLVDSLKKGDAKTPSSSGAPGTSGSVVLKLQTHIRQMEEIQTTLERACHELHARRREAARARAPMHCAEKDLSSVPMPNMRGQVLAQHGLPLARPKKTAICLQEEEPSSSSSSASTPVYEVAYSYDSAKTEAAFMDLKESNAKFRDMLDELEHRPLERPSSGCGEILKHYGSDVRSLEITQKDRFVYRIVPEGGNRFTIHVISCQGHYTH